MKYVDGLRDHISGYNFNKYYQPPSSPHPSISIRFNVTELDLESVKQTVLDLSKKLLENGEIRSYDKQLSAWDEPEFVVKAHELGTLCAVEFKNRMERNDELYQKFRTNPVEFMVYFAYIILRSIGFDVKIIWSLLRFSPIRESEVTEIASSCSEIFHGKLGDNEVSPDFMERFVHAFFNCTYSQAKSVFKNWISESRFWKEIVDL
jgi:hypothetical protein